MIIIINDNHYHYIVVFSFWQYKKGLNTTIIFWNILHLKRNKLLGIFGWKYHYSTARSGAVRGDAGLFDRCDTERVHLGFDT